MLGEYLFGHFHVLLFFLLAVSYAFKLVPRNSMEGIVGSPNILLGHLAESLNLMKHL